MDVLRTELSYFYPTRDVLRRSAVGAFVKLFSIFRSHQISSQYVLENVAESWEWAQTVCERIGRCGNCLLYFYELLLHGRTADDLDVLRTVYEQTSLVLCWQILHVLDRFAIFEGRGKTFCELHWCDSSILS